MALVGQRPLSSAVFDLFIDSNWDGKYRLREYTRMEEFIPVVIDICDGGYNFSRINNCLFVSWISLSR